jgi:hypothetical protein
VALACWSPLTLSDSAARRAYITLKGALQPLQMRLWEEGLRHPVCGSEPFELARNVQRCASPRPCSKIMAKAEGIFSDTRVRDCRIASLTYCWRQTVSMPHSTICTAVKRHPFFSERVTVWFG